MNKLKRFLSENTNSKSKHIIFIKINKNLIKEKIFLNKSNDFKSKLIYRFFFNNLNFRENNSKSEASQFNGVKKFDQIFILSEEKNYKRYYLKKYLMNLKKYAKNGASVMICMSNKQNIFNIYRYNKNIKKENLTISKSLLLYDYLYFTNFNSLKIFNYLDNVLIFNRFFFLANNIIVKFKYVSEFKFKN